MISVIVPTYNRTDCVIALLRCLLKQDIDDFEVIIVDQSEARNKALIQFIESISSEVLIKYFWISKKGRSLAKNFGIAESKGEYLVFCDDDITVGPNFLSTHIATLGLPKVGAASCRLVEEGDPLTAIKVPLAITRYGKLINKPYATSSTYVTSLNGGNMSFRREVISSAGFFEEDFIGTSMVEEPDMAYRVMRIGYRLYFNAAITVRHYPQINGNISIMRNKRAEWFYAFFYNLLFFYSKYGQLRNLPLVLSYSMMVALKHSIIDGFKPTVFGQFLKGGAAGLKRGIRYYNQTRSELYYTSFKSKNEIQIKYLYVNK